MWGEVNLNQPPRTLCVGFLFYFEKWFKSINRNLLWSSMFKNRIQGKLLCCNRNIMLVITNTSTWKLGIHDSCTLFQQIIRRVPWAYTDVFVDQVKNFLEEKVKHPLQSREQTNQQTKTASLQPLSQSLTLTHSLPSCLPSTLYSLR